MTEQNEIDLVKRHYKDTEKKSFSNLDCCWAILEHKSPDFSQVPNTATTNADSTPTSGGSVQSPRNRPSGCKALKAKQLKTKKTKGEECEFLNLMEKSNQTTANKEGRRAEMEARRVASLERNMANEERRVALEERKTTMKEKEMEARIMQMDLDLVQDPQMKAYYQYDVPIGVQ
ncbi:hypothetical protein C3L33_19711, partial [Rhododendron williamsianum]